MEKRTSVADDRELFEKLEQAGLADRLMADPAWGLLRKAADRIVEKALKQFVLNTKPTEIEKIIEFQLLVRKYKYGKLFAEIEELRQEGELAYEEAKERGILGSSTGT